MTAPLFDHELGPNAAELAIGGQPETTFLSWNKPLSAEEQLIIDVILGRYTDAGMPLVTFETESLVTLRIPHIVKRRAS